MTSPPSRWLDEGSDATELERRLLRRGLDIDPPTGAKAAVWASVVAGLPPVPAGSGGGGPPAGGPPGAAGQAAGAGGIGAIGMLKSAAVGGALMGALLGGYTLATAPSAPSAPLATAAPSTPSVPSVPSAIARSSRTAPAPAEVAPPRSRDDAPAAVTSAAPALALPPPSASAPGAGAAKPADPPTSAAPELAARTAGEPRPVAAGAEGAQGAASAVPAALGASPERDPGPAPGVDPGGGAGPAASAGADPQSRLREEADLVRQAREALRSGNGALALALLEQIRARIPGGVLTQEREALAIEALDRTGQRAAAATRAAAFLRAYPGSPHAAWVRLFAP